MLAKGEVQRHNLPWKIGKLPYSEMKMSEEAILGVEAPEAIPKTHEKTQRPVTCSVGLNLVGGALEKQ